MYWGERWTAEAAKKEVVNLDQRNLSPWCGNVKNFIFENFILRLLIEIKLERGKFEARSYLSIVNLLLLSTFMKQFGSLDPNSPVFCSPLKTPSTERYVL